MRRLFICAFTLMSVFLSLTGSINAEEKLNELTFKINVDHDNDSIAEMAGYSYENAEFTVYNSKNETVGRFVIDKDGCGHVNNIDSETVMYLKDDIYTVRQSTAFKGYKAIAEQKVMLSKAPLLPEKINVNTFTYLYGFNSQGNIFDKNELIMWTTDFGTGSILCGDDGYASPSEIKVPSSGGSWGNHQVSIRDISILPRNSETNELVYKIMYYGYHGPKIWSGFSRYKTPYPSRNQGQTFFSTGESNNQLVAYYLTHAALSRAFNREGVIKAAEKQQGFSEFWQYVKSAPAAPENFYVYRWDNDNDPKPTSGPSAGKGVQAMFLSAVGGSETDKKEIAADTYPVFSKMELLLTKFNSKNEYLRDVEFRISYYPDEINEKSLKKWIFKTDDNGQIKLSDEYLVCGDELFKNSKAEYVLPLGNYLAEEIKAPEGYIKADNFIIEVRDENSPILWNENKTEIIKVTDKGYELLEYKKAYVQIHKTAADQELEKENPVAGSKYGLYEDPQCQKPARDINGNECFLTIRENNYSEVLTLKPGKYYLRELETPFVWHLDETVYEIEAVESFNADVRSIREHVNYPQNFLIRTTASYVESDGEQKGTINSVFKLTDVVEYENLKPGHEYVLKTTLMDRDSKKEIKDSEGKTIIKETEFRAEKDSGKVEIAFDLPARIALNKTIVIYEELFYKEKSLVRHFDLDDPKQTLVFPEAKCVIAVTKVDKDDDKKLLKNCEFTIFNDDGTIAVDIDGRPAIKKTDENGLSSFELKYPESGYYLMETKAPGGYEISTEKIRIKVSDNIEEAKNKAVEIRVVNARKESVQTSDSNNGFIWYILLLLSSLTAFKYTMGKLRKI